MRAEHEGLPKAHHQRIVRPRARNSQGRPRKPDPPISPRSTGTPTLFSRIYALVRRVPSGRVVTYGQIAGALGMPPGARTVGWAMRVCGEGLPWHRVVNSKGEISFRPTAGFHEQRLRLQEEGVRFDRAGKIDLAQYGWKRL